MCTRQRTVHTSSSYLLNLPNLIRGLRYITLCWTWLASVEWTNDMQFMEQWIIYVYTVVCWMVYFKYSSQLVIGIQFTSLHYFQFTIDAQMLLHIVCRERLLDFVEYLTRSVKHLRHNDFDLLIMPLGWTFAYSNRIKYCIICR
jgi:hypothetical protein